MPKGYLRDTGLINYFLRIQTVNDLKSHPQAQSVKYKHCKDLLKNMIAHLDY